MDDALETIFFKHCWGVFEGGGVRAAALAGAYEAAVSSGVNFGRVAGTSAGSIIAALISSGADPKFILDALNSKNFKDFMGPPDQKDNAFGAKLFAKFLTGLSWGRLGTLLKIWRNSGIYSSSEVQKWLDQLLCEQLSVNSPVKFKDLKLPLYVVASDVVEGRPRVWCKERTPNDSVAFAVRCSCSIPFYFQPISDSVSLLVDGGMISNLPAWVFSNFDTREMWSRVLCFRLQESGSTKIENLTDFMECMVSTVISGGSEVQLYLQPNVYVIDIPTGKYKATDFHKIDGEAKSWLRNSGFNSVKNFIAVERMTVRNRQDNMVYSGFDEKLLLMVQYLGSATDDVIIVSSDSYWLYFIFPALVFALQRGIVINVVLKRVDKLDPNFVHETHRQQQLINMGVNVHLMQVLPFDGLIFDRNKDNSVAVVSTAEGVLGKDYKYSEEKIRVYTGAHDAPIIHALNMSFNSVSLGQNEKVSLSLRPIDPEVIFEKLKNIHQYRQSRFTLEYVSLSDNIYSLDLYIKEFRLTQVLQLVDAFKRSNIDLFSPAVFQMGDEAYSIVTPPVLEKIGEKLVIIEGATRLYYAFKNKIKLVRAIVINNVETPLPAKPHPISRLNLASDTIDRSELFEDFNESEIRPIERVLHSR